MPLESTDEDTLLARPVDHPFESAVLEPASPSASPGPPTRRNWAGPALALVLVMATLGAAGDLLGWFRTAPAVVASVGVQVPVTATSYLTGRANNSPTIATDPGDSRFMALANRLDAPGYGCALNVSGDGGAGWAPAKPFAALPAGVDECYGPEVAFDGGGKLYFTFVGLAGQGHLPVGAFITESSDRGRTFSEPRQVLGPLNFGVRMAIDPRLGSQGRIHLVWLHASSQPGLGSLGSPPNPILAAHSDDGGRTFSTPVPVSDSKPGRVVGPALALGPDRAVHVAYYELGDDVRDYQGLEGPVWEGTWQLMVASSSDGGQKFGHGVVADAEVVPHDRVAVVFTMPPPSLVAGKGRVCVAWTDARYGDADALARCSTDSARTWAGVRRLNDDQRANGSWQYLPRLAIAPGGRLDAIFYDRRNDEQNLNNAVSYTYSNDGGRSFAKSTQITTEGPSFSMIGQRYAVPSSGDRYDFGARMALVSEPDRVVAAWADTHNSEPPSTDQDIFATTVTLPGSSSGTKMPALVILAVVAVVAGLVMARKLKGRPTQVSDAEASAAE